MNKLSELELKGYRQISNNLPKNSVMGKLLGHIDAIEAEHSAHELELQKKLDEKQATLESVIRDHSYFVNANVAAVLEPLGKLVEWYKTNHPTNPWPSFGYPNLLILWEQIDAILALRTTSQISALEQDRARVREDEFKNTVIMCTAFPTEQVKILIKARAAELRAAGQPGEKHDAR